MHRNRKRERGGAMLESALVLLTFLGVFLGILDFGQMLFMHQTIVERVRSAARTGAINDYSINQIQNLVAYNQTSAPAAGTAGLFGMAPANVAVTLPDAGTFEARVVVRVTGVRMLLLNPFAPGALQNIPVQVVVPVEKP